MISLYQIWVSAIEVFVPVILGMGPPYLYLLEVACISTVKPPVTGLLVGPRLLIQYIRATPSELIGPPIRHTKDAPYRGYKVLHGIYILLKIFPT